jgi:cbb3-type cytochrome oxidase subunit 3
MKLSDIMSYAQLSWYTEIALLLFLGVFIAVSIHTFMPSRRQEHDEAARLPLEDDEVLTPRTPRTTER